MKPPSACVQLNPPSLWLCSSSEHDGGREGEGGVNSLTAAARRFVPCSTTEGTRRETDSKTMKTTSPPRFGGNSPPLPSPLHPFPPLCKSEPEHSLCIELLKIKTLAQNSPPPSAQTLPSPRRSATISTRLSLSPFTLVSLLSHPAETLVLAPCRLVDAVTHQDARPSSPPPSSLESPASIFPLPLPLPLPSITSQHPPYTSLSALTFSASPWCLLLAAGLSFITLLD